MAMAGVDFHALRSQIDIRAVLNLLGFLASERRGDHVRGPCPVHGARLPESRSFSIHLKRNAYRCFRCGSQGNQLDLWAAATRQPLYEATLDLCAKLHLRVPRLGRSPPAPEKSPPAS